MFKKTAAFAIAMTICAGAANYMNTTALAAPQAKYYDLKQKKWVPMSENQALEKSRMRMEEIKNNMMKKAEQKPAMKKMEFKRPEFKKPEWKKPEWKKPEWKKPEWKKPEAPKKSMMGAEKKESIFDRFKKSFEKKKMLRPTAVVKKKPVKQASVKQDPNESPIPATIIPFEGRYSKGTIVIDHSDRRLYHVLGGGMAKAYAVGVGKEGFEWTGTKKITRKAEWPSWTPPQRMIEREKKKGRILPAHMEGGPNNPLGARAMYLGTSYYRIHGTNQPWSLGKAVSSGCIRMANNDVSELYTKIGVGTKVVVRP